MMIAINSKDYRLTAMCAGDGISSNLYFLTMLVTYVLRRFYYIARHIIRRSFHLINIASLFHETYIIFGEDAIF